ncbi:hypothetical protein CBR_g26142 [Chara braunii]|uniref:Sulfotransferase n=1 Tax=Chara braunii TaxID=69332 RepID=A0A388JVY4_CHABU|nr:hypothetical protein CBR_g26142 [Chara braunii]|eukprot:GBG61979.1 hypothetical protein CBR_g26142 [Chara braunii]
MASFPDPSARSGRSQSQGGDPLTAAKHAQRAGTGALAMATLQDQLAATMRRERGGGKAAAAGEKGGATAATSSTTAGAYELSSTAARGQRGTSFSIPGTASWIAPPSGELAQSGSGAGGGDQSSAFRASTAGSSDSVGRSTSFDRRTIGSSSMVGGGGTGHGSGNSGAGGGGKVGGGVAVAAGDGGGGEGAATGQQLQGGEGGGTTLPRVRSPTLDGRKVGGGERERGGREGSVGGSGGAAVLTTTSSARSLSSQGTADHGGTDAMSDIIDRLLYHASSIGDEAGSEGGADVAAGSESGTVEDEAAAEPFDPFCINVWSGPRSMSTCLMYSFLQRDDVCALDEPLYAHFLRHTGVWRPYRDRLLAEMDSNGDRVVQDVILSPRKKKILFVKQMGKHIAGLSHQSRESLLMGTRHVILIRNPIASLVEVEEEECVKVLGYGGWVVEVEVEEGAKVLGYGGRVKEVKVEGVKVLGYGGWVKEVEVSPVAELMVMCGCRVCRGCSCTSGPLPLSKKLLSTRP